MVGNAVILEGGWDVVVSTPGPKAFGDRKRIGPQMSG